MAIDPEGLEGEAYLIAVLKNIEESAQQLRDFTSQNDELDDDDYAHILWWADLLELVVYKAEEYDVVDTLNLHPIEQEMRR